MDITMCTGGDCPLKEQCYRFKAVPNKFRQSMFMTIPYDKEEEKCKYFWKNDEEQLDLENDD